jgi:hypothetical protein
MTVLVAEERVSADGEHPVLGVASTESVCADRGFAFPGYPAGIAIASDGTVFASDATSRTIWRIDQSGRRTLASAPAGGALDAITVGDRVLSPAGLALGPDGTVAFADVTGHRVWAISPDRELRLVAGSVYGYRDGPCAEALFRYPSDVAIGPDGTWYVADTGNDRIRTITPEGVVGTLGGSIYDYGDGRGSAARFRRPQAIAVGKDGSCYVADTGNNAIRRITPDGEVTTVAGSPPGGDHDGVGVEVGLRWPSGLALGPDEDLWVVDHGNGALREIDHSGASRTRLRFSDRHWPAALASAPLGGMVVATVLLDDVRHPRACLISMDVG